MNPAPSDYYVRYCEEIINIMLLKYKILIIEGAG
jgi:hypothetical protein